MADEKEVTVKIMTEVDDADVSDLEDRLEELNNNQLEVDVTSDSSEVDNVESSVEDLETEIETVNNTSVSPPGDSSGVDSVSESVNSLNDALTAVGAGVSLAGMEQLVDTAGNINDSWNRLGLTFGEVSGQMKTDIAEAGAATGRSGSLIRGYFNDMGIAGVTNTELLQQSFEALSGRAYQTGNSIESMEQKMKMMVMSGNAGARQLTQLGISTADLGRVMGVSADEASKMFKTLSQEERLRVLTKAMGDGKNANEMYKNSWQGLKDQVDKATGALMGAIGNMILPFLVPAMQVATQAIEALSAGFKALPAPIQGVIGGVLAVVMGFLALTTVISTVKTLANAIQFVSTATQLLSGVTKIATAAQSALNLTMLANPYVLVAAAILALVAALVYCYNTNEEFRNSVNQLFNDLQRLANGDWHVIVEYEQKGGDLAVDTAGMLASNDLSQGLSRMLMGDEAVNQANAEMDGFLENIKTKMHEGMEAFWNDGTQGILGWLAELAGIDVGSYLQSFTAGFNGIGESINGVIMGIQGFIMQLLQIPVFIQQAVQQGIANFQSFVGQVSGILNNIIGIAASFGGQLISQLGSAASNATSSFISGISGLASGFIGELESMLSYAVSWASSLASTMASAASNAVSSFLGALQIHSPGIMQRKFIGEMEGIVTAATDTGAPLGSAMRDVGNNAVNNFDIRGLNNPTVPTSGTQANAGGVTMNIVINGDVDNEERMERFADYIITRMNWDNSTAGRTV